MSGILGIGGGGDTEFYPYTLDQSVRFNDDDTAMLSRTFASAGNRRTWTWSGWVKRANIGNTHPLFVAGSSGSSVLQCAIQTSTVADRLALYNYTGSYNLNFATTQLFRDVSGWYHIVLKMDTTQATSTNRVKIYVNGDEVTSFSTSSYPSQNFETLVNTAASHRIGRNFDTAVSTKSLDGYVAEVNFVDSPIFTAATTSGSATVTGISSTATLKVGMAVSSSTTSVIPDGTTIASIDSSSQITLSANATATNGSVSLTFSPTIDFFGETKNGIWIPKEYTGPYGTNGFYLNFKDDIVSEGFNTVTYQGKGATQSISGLGFSPDFVWIKNRTSTAGVHHALFDSVRGSSGGYFYKLLSSFNGSQTYYSQGAYGSLTSIDGDGFTVSSSNSDYQQTNASGDNYVAWAWDAGTGSAASNTDGDITSTVKANTAYGFSVVQFESDGVNEVESVGHGLGTAPSFIITKNIDGTTNWPCYHASLGNNYRTDLNGNGASTDNGQQTFGSDTNTFSVWKSNLFGSGTCIAYCFAEISGYSKFGSYSGTGASGNTVSCGFRPAFLMVKRTDSTQSWLIVDNTREPNDSAAKTLELSPNITDEEPTYSGGDVATFTSTGFELAVGNVNLSGGEYIFIAFADTRDYAFWKDQSGNGNHFTPENLEYTDTLKDTPTNSFSTLNPLLFNTTPTLQEGNLEASLTSSTGQSGRSRLGSTFSVTSGKWYWELTLPGTGQYVGFGISRSGFRYMLHTDPTEGVGFASFQTQATAAVTYYAKDGTGSTATTTTGPTVTDIIQIALDADDGKMWIGDGTNWYSGDGSGDITGTSGDPAAGTNASFTGLDFSEAWTPMIEMTGSNKTESFLINFGQDSTFAGATTAGGNADANGIGDFYYAPPSGYLALCAANLPDPGIDPAADEAPEDYFNTVLYTGNETARSITGVGFQPDWVWIKRRSSTFAHNLYDVVRGAGNHLVSNNDSIESTTTTRLTAFESDGFALGTGTALNQSSGTYVAWNWKAGGTAVSNGDGTITSSVSASPESGFSIVSYTGTGSAGTVGHGLGKAPSMVILKNRDGAYFWAIYHAGLAAPATTYLEFDTVIAQTGETHWNSTAPTSTVFSVNTQLSVNNLSDEYIAYCFADIDGMVKTGSYVGNNSTTFVYTGFRPAFVMIKSSNQTRNWITFDNKRTPTNQMDGHLHPNADVNEQTGTDEIDFLSNGFNLRSPDNDTNTSAFEYIYMAFAEQPFKYANAR